MDLSHFRMLIHELLNKDTYIFPEAGPIIILYSKSAVCMTNNGKDTKYNKYISKRVNFVRNGEKCKLKNIDWYEGGIQLEDIATIMLGIMI